MDNLVIELGALYIFDRGYLNYKRLYKIKLSHAFFIVRTKSNLSFKILKFNEVDKNTGLKYAQIIRLKIKKFQKGYPKNLRRIKVYDEAQKNILFC